jgi:hypothetical protein
MEIILNHFTIDLNSINHLYNLDIDYYIEYF